MRYSTQKTINKITLTREKLLRKRSLEVDGLEFAIIISTGTNQVYKCLRGRITARPTFAQCLHGDHAAFNQARGEAHVPVSSRGGKGRPRGQLLGSCARLSVSLYAHFLVIIQSFTSGSSYSSLTVSNSTDPVSSHSYTFHDSFRFYFIFPVFSNGPRACAKN